MPSDTFYSSFSAVGGNCTLRGRHSPRFFPWLLYRVVRKQDKASDTHYWYKHYKDQDEEIYTTVAVRTSLWGEFPVLHSSSSAIDTVHWIAIYLILGLCNRKENPQSPKPCWQNSLSQSLGPMICGPHTQKTAWTYPDTQKKKQHSTPQSTTLISTQSDH